MPDDIRYRVLKHKDASLIDVLTDQTAEQAAAIVNAYHNPDIQQTVTVIPRLPVPDEVTEIPPPNNVLPTPLYLWGADTSIGIIMVATDEPFRAKAYVDGLLAEYKTLTGKATEFKGIVNIAPVHAVYINGAIEWDTLDPAELAEFDYPGITNP